MLVIGGQPVRGVDGMPHRFRGIPVPASMLRIAGAMLRTHAAHRREAASFISGGG
jgi:hypothetical protein